jgi:hypothetical protein
MGKGLSDAQKFILAAGITDATQKSAINTLVNDLKSYGIWSKMNALYPMVGGSATTHKYNLKDPRDLDAAFRLSFNGGWTHSSNGIQGNNSNTYANTFFSSLNNDSSFWLYSRTNLLNTSQIDMGVFSGVNPSSSNNGIAISFSDGKTYLYENIAATTGTISYTSTSSLGLFGANRTTSALSNGWHNGVKKITNTGSSGVGTTIPIYVGGYNADGVLYYVSSKEFAFAAVGNGLTDTEAANFYTIVQAYQTTLGRQV